MKIIKVFIYNKLPLPPRTIVFTFMIFLMVITTTTSKNLKNISPVNTENISTVNTENISNISNISSTRDLVKMQNEKKLHKETDKKDKESFLKTFSQGDINNMKRSIEFYNDLCFLTLCVICGGLLGVIVFLIISFKNNKQTNFLED